MRLNADVQNGYFIDGTLFLNVPGTRLVGVSNYGYKAVLTATSALTGPILNGNAPGYTIEGIMFNGNKWGRPRPSDAACADGNVVLRGSFTVAHVETRAAACGSGMAVEGQFEIRDSYFVFNGFEEPAGLNPPQWSDGLTVWNCQNGRIHHNTFWDNTDVDLIVGGGLCTVEDNTIDHSGAYGFAGLMVGWFPGGDGNHTGSVFRRNHVTSSLNKLAFGIMVGSHPWTVDWPFINAGSVTGNSSSGAVINLMVEAVLDNVNAAGVVDNNDVSAARGNEAFGNCTRSTDRAAFHNGSIYLQPGVGWLPLQFDNSQCQQ